MKLAPFLKAPFLHEGKVDKLLLALFLAINLLVLTNDILHDPEIGYDAKHYLRYIQILPFRLPTDEDTREFFSAPLPYILPSFVDEGCHHLSGVREVPLIVDDCLRNAGKFAQFINFILSLGVTFLFIKIADVVRPNNRFLKISSLALLGVMTVYYRTFSQVRGEPYVVFFTVWAIYLLSKMIYARERLAWRSGIGLGIILGLLILSRQWGLMLVPAILGLMALVWMLDRTHGWQLGRALATSFIIAFLICSWFYLHLYLGYGSVLAFNRSPRAFSLSNRPLSFYRSTGLKKLLLFKTPTREAFNNQFFPLFYSDVWGDYWGYFVFIQVNSTVLEKGYQGNRQQIRPYLGRVNAAALFPSFIFGAGILTGAFSVSKLFRSDQEEKSRALFYTFLLIFGIVSFILYMYFLITYTMTNQDTTNKATYMLHALIVLPLLGAEFLERVRVRYPRGYLAGMALLGLVFLHNLPAMITHYRALF